MINTYYIGGSPCAGKSTVAEILSKNTIYTTLKWMIFLIIILNWGH